MRRIGVLTGGFGPDSQARLEAFLKALAQLGWTDGQNVRLEIRRGGGDADAIRRHATELAALAPDVIMAVGGTATGALLQATRTVPIVFAIVPDPIGSGFVASLSRPGGNATGFLQFEYGLSGKWLELLKEIRPGLTHVGPDVKPGHGLTRVLPFGSPSDRRDQMEFCIGRREFITLIGGAAATWPLVAWAQQSALPVIGVLNSASPEAFAPFVAAFQSGLNELGYIEGRNVMIEYRSAEGHPDRLPPLVDDLVRRQVAVLVANSTASALAAKSVTSSLPIVFLTGGDPVELGLIASLNRPGGNATGVSFLVNKLVAKRLELLSELAPGAVTLGMLVDPNNPNAEPDTKDAQVAADALGRKLLVVKAAAESELDAAFATLAQMQVANLFVAANVNFITWRDQIMALAMRYGIAASYATRDFVMAGGLMSYGPDRTEVWRQIGLYAGRILKGAKPADMPVMQSAQFEFVINLRTAKAQALAIPPALLALANEVIE